MWNEKFQKILCEAHSLIGLGQLELNYKTKATTKAEQVRTPIKLETKEFTVKDFAKETEPIHTGCHEGLRNDIDR